MKADRLVKISAIFIYSRKKDMKGFRKPKEPTKAELKKAIEGLNKALS